MCIRDSIKDSHPPIVTHEEAEAVRNLMAYRVDVLHMNKSDSVSYTHLANASAKMNTTVKDRISVDLQEAGMDISDSLSDCDRMGTG